MFRISRIHSIKPVHLGHAVVAEDELVHGQCSTSLKPVFNQVDRLVAVDHDGGIERELEKEVFHRQCIHLVVFDD